MAILEYILYIIFLIVVAYNSATNDSTFVNVLFCIICFINIFINIIKMYYLIICLLLKGKDF